MKTLIFWTSLILLFLIHSVDMELTTHYIGNDWELEMFPPMSFCIKHFGIYASVWISRLIMYPCFFLAFKKRHSETWVLILTLSTILYYVGMTGWLFYLQIIAWPFF